MAAEEFVVFYAWQSDSPSRDNRSFIEKSLDQGLKTLERSGSIESSPRLDKDTKDVPGLPDIANTILDKIRGADAFVADVSFVASTGADETGNSKLIPNPNVMIELGYALAELGWERIILVLNTASGLPDKLPFDLRNRRWPFVYEITKDSSEVTRAEAKKKLAGQLHDATEAIAKLPSRQKRGAVEQRLTALETMVASLSGNSAQDGILAQLISSLQGGATKAPEPSNDARKKCQQSRDSLIERVSNDKFHGIAFQQGMLIASIQPAFSPDSLPLFDPQYESLLNLSLRPLGASGWGPRTLGDRFVTYTDYGKPIHDAVTEIVVDGTVNAAGHDVLAIKPEYWEFMNKKAPENLIGIPSVAFEKQVIEAIAGYVKCLKALGTTGPWWVALAAINVRKSVLFVNQNLMFSGRPFEGDQMLLPIVEIPVEVDLENQQVVARALRPAFDYLWREHNFPRSLNYAETGDWVGQ